MLEKKEKLLSSPIHMCFPVSLPHTGTLRHMCCSTPRIYPRVRTRTLPTGADLACYQHIAELNRGSEDAERFNYLV